MAGYLDQYGAGEERRNRIIIRSILTVLAIVVVWTLGWYLLLNHHEEGVVKQFVAALKRGDTQGAYKIWNCAAADTCRDYTYEKFMQDWGPGPTGPDLARIGLTDSEECNNAAMVTVRVNASRVEQLWVEPRRQFHQLRALPDLPRADSLRDYGAPQPREAEKNTPAIN